MTIGDNEVVSQQTIIVRNGPNAIVKFDAVVWHTPVKFVVRFVGAINPIGESKYFWSIDNGTVKIDFENWSNQFGLVTDNPVLLGTIAGKPFGFSASHTIIGGQVHIMHLIVLQGGTYGKN